MSLSPADGVDQGLEQVGVTFAVNLLAVPSKVKFIDVSSAPNEVDVNAGVPDVETVTEAPFLLLYQEQALVSVDIVEAS